MTWRALLRRARSCGDHTATAYAKLRDAEERGTGARLTSDEVSSLVRVDHAIQMASECIREAYEEAP